MTPEPEATDESRLLLDTFVESYLPELKLMFSILPEDAILEEVRSSQAASHTGEIDIEGVLERLVGRASASQTVPIIDLTLSEDPPAQDNWQTDTEVLAALMAIDEPVERAFASKTLATVIRNIIIHAPQNSKYCTLKLTNTKVRQLYDDLGELLSNIGFEINNENGGLLQWNRSASDDRLVEAHTLLETITASPVEWIGVTPELLTGPVPPPKPANLPTGGSTSRYTTSGKLTREAIADLTEQRLKKQGRGGQWGTGVIYSNKNNRPRVHGLDDLVPDSGTTHFADDYLRMIHGPAPAGSMTELTQRYSAVEYLGRKILDLCNVARHENGKLGRLQWHDGVAAVARAHAEKWHPFVKMLQSMDIDAWSLQVLREKVTAAAAAASVEVSSSVDVKDVESSPIQLGGSNPAQGAQTASEVPEACADYCRQYGDKYTPELDCVMKVCQGICQDFPTIDTMQLTHYILHRLCCPHRSKPNLIKALLNYFNIPIDKVKAAEALVSTAFASACSSPKAALRLWASLVYSDQQPSAVLPLVAAAFLAEFEDIELGPDDVEKLLRVGETYQVPQSFVTQWGKLEDIEGYTLTVEASLIAAVLHNDFKKDTSGDEIDNMSDGLFGYSLKEHSIYQTATSDRDHNNRKFVLLDARRSDCVTRCDSEAVVESYWIQRAVEPKRRPTLPTEDWMKDLDELDDSLGKEMSQEDKPKVEHIRKERPVVVHRLRGKFAITIDGDASYGEESSPEKEALLGKLSATDVYGNKHIVIIGEGPMPDEQSSIMADCLSPIKHVSVLEGGWPAIIKALCDLDNSTDFLNWVAFCGPFTERTLPKRSASQSSAANALLKPETLESLQVNWEESKKNMAKGWDAFGKSMSSAWKDLGAAAQKQTAAATAAVATRRSSSSVGETQDLASDPSGPPSTGLNFNNVLRDEDKAAITENMNKAKNVMAGWIAKSDKFIHEQQVKLAKQQEEKRLAEERKKAETAAIIAVMQDNGGSATTKGGGKKVPSGATSSSTTGKVYDEDVLSEDEDDNIFEIGDESSGDEDDDGVFVDKSLKDQSVQRRAEQSCLQNASVMVGTLQRLGKGDVVSWEEDLLPVGARRFKCQKLTHQSRLDRKAPVAQKVEKEEAGNWWNNAKKFATSLAAPFDPLVPVDRVIILVLNQLLICEDIGGQKLRVKSNHRVQQIQRVSFAEDHPDKISFLYRNSSKCNTYKLLPLPEAPELSPNQQLMTCLKQRLSSLNVGMRLTVTDGPPRPMAPPLPARDKNSGVVDHDDDDDLLN